MWESMLWFVIPFTAVGVVGGVVGLWLWWEAKREVDPDETDRWRFPVLIPLVALSLLVGCANAVTTARVTCAALDRTLAVERATLAEYTESYLGKLETELAAGTPVAEVKAKRDAYALTHNKLKLQIAVAHGAVGLCETTATLVETKAKDASVLGPIISKVVEVVDGIVAAVQGLTAAPAK